MINENDLAGTANPGPEQPEVNPDTAREIFVMKLDKDFSTTPPDNKDFRPRAETAEEAPKGSSVLGSVTPPTSVTGLEDVSQEDLDDPVSKTVTKDTNQAITSVDGSQTFSKVT